MSETLPVTYIVRHGETSWSLSGQHTGRTDLPLTERGRERAVLIGRRLNGISFDHVFSSPRIRALQTCELAGFKERVAIDQDLEEWDYGDYEGKTSREIRAINPTWQLFRDGCPGGESIEQISARADRVVARWRALEGTSVAFSSGHILRVIASRWLGLPGSDGRLFALDTGTIGMLGYEHNKDEPAIRLWNDSDHIPPSG